MQMQRYKPQEWNEFLIVALDSWNSSSYPLKDWTIKVKISIKHFIKYINMITKLKYLL